jgi:hypothetical protein
MRVVNTSRTEKLRLYTLYAPPEHKDGTVHRAKSDEPPHAPSPRHSTKPDSTPSATATDAQMRARALSRWEGETTGDAMEFFTFPQPR